MVNITMLCANRPRLLKQALDSIGDLGEATMTIRDAGMSLEVGDIADMWCVTHQDRVVVGSENNLGTGPSRNEVVLASERIYGRGDYLYLSDDDVFWTRPDWLDILVAAYEKAKKSGFKVIGAYNHPFNQPIDRERWVGVDRNMNTDETVAPRWFDVYPVYAVASQSMLMSWDVWDEFGPFCDTPAGKVCQSEDVEFCNRIRAAGYKVGVVSPWLLANTGITNSFGEKIPGWELVKSQCPEGVICE